MANRATGRRPLARKAATNARTNTDERDPIEGDAPEDNAADLPAGGPEETGEDKEDTDTPEADESPAEGDTAPETSKSQTTLAKLDETPFRKEWLKFLADAPVAVPKGRILFPYEPLTFVGQKIAGDKVVLTEDIYRMVVPFRSKRPIFTLIARAGTTYAKTQMVSQADYIKAVSQIGEDK